MTEKNKVSIRNIRREANEELKKNLKIKIMKMKTKIMKRVPKTYR